MLNLDLKYAEFGLSFNGYFGFKWLTNLKTALHLELLTLIVFSCLYMLNEFYSLHPSLHKRTVELSESIGKWRKSEFWPKGD